MKYMIMMFGGLGASVADRSPEWIGEMHQLMMGIDGELRESGELVASQALVDPARARAVRMSGGAAVPTDGPFAEVKEALAGYWIIDGTEERALEITARVVGFTEFPMEVRMLMDDAAMEPGTL